MKIYDYQGNEYNAYNYQGDINESIDIDTVPTYFQTKCINALDYVNDLGSDYVNYLVATDSHYSSNNGNTFKIMNYLYSNGDFDKMIHLGDLEEGGRVEESHWQSVLATDIRKFKKWLFTAGNHDQGLYYNQREVFDYLIGDYVHYISRSDTNNNYYYDNDKAKIRFIATHHFSMNTTNVTNALRTKPSDYAWCFISHYPMLPVDIENDIWKRVYCMTENFENSLKQLIEQYPNCIGIFSGHQHFDQYDKLSTSNGTQFNHLTLDADVRRSSESSENSQVVSILSINTKTRSVKLYRIGRNKVFENSRLEFNY